MEVLGIIAFVLYWILKSVGDSNRQRRQKEAEQTKRAQPPDLDKDRERRKREVPVPPMFPWMMEMDEEAEEEVSEIPAHPLDRQRRAAEQAAPVMPPEPAAELPPETKTVIRRQPVIPIEEPRQKRAERKKEPAAKKEKKAVYDVPVKGTGNKAAFKSLLSGSNIANGIILAEVLQPPVSKRARHGR